MATVTVYKGDEEVSHENVNQEYYIVESSSGELFWYEQGQSSPGTLKIWLQNRIERSGKDSFLLCYVLPDWQLIIDGVWMEKKFYEDIDNLRGKNVELRYKDFRFVFQFELD
jgi:hypothetical protein